MLEKEAELEASAARLQKLETCVSQRDSAVGRQIVDKLTSSLRLSLNASEADTLADLTADLVKKNRENDILENCLKASNIPHHSYYYHRLRVFVYYQLASQNKTRSVDVTYV